MPSSFMAKRNYAHCPLKKRPLALYNETCPEQDEPEDLSIKRPKLEETVIDLRKPPTPPVIPERTFAMEHPHRYTPYTNYRHIPISAPIPVAPRVHRVPAQYPSFPNQQTESVSSPQNNENLPSLAEYYLQLFRKTSEAEKKEMSKHPMPWNGYTMPMSPQHSPVTPEQLVSSAVPTPGRFHNESPLQIYPDSSALISPVSSCSSLPSDEEDELRNLQESRSLRHSCESCGKSYTTPSGLSKHKQLHCSALGPRVFSCKHCAKTYTSVGALKMHIRTHTLPCKCHICGKAFSRPWLLQGHIRTHTGEKPFECSQCDRSFADRSNLRAHLQTHAHVKKYACKTCHKTFSRMSLLNKHSETSCLAARSPTSQYTEYQESEHIDVVGEC